MVIEYSVIFSATGEKQVLKIKDLVSVNSILHHKRYRAEIPV